MKLNILRVYPFLPPLSGGMEKHIKMLTQEQRIQGHNVSVAFSDGARTSVDDIRVCSNKKLKGIRPQSFRDFVFYIELICVLLRHKTRFDVVHIHGAWSAFIFGGLLKKITGAKVLVGSIHAKLKTSYFWDNVYPFLFRRYSFLYCTGNIEAEFLNKKITPRVYWRTSGIDPLFFQGEILNKDFDVVSIGSFVPVKNYDFMLDIAKEAPELKFAFVGDGSRLTHIKQRASKEQIKNVTFLGALDYQGVANVLKRSKVFLMTSFSEGTPTVLLEALASGNIIVTSNSNDYSELIENNVTGYIIPDFVVSEYLNVIIKILDSPNDFVTVIQQNKDQAKNSAWSSVAFTVTNWMIEKTMKCTSK